MTPTEQTKLDSAIVRVVYYTDESCTVCRM